ncbi:MAG: hypothetical protein ACI9YE_001170 [Psychroserpens sp.]|jgi:hypothetical protein
MAKIALLFLITFVMGILYALIQGAQWAFYLYEIIYFLNPGFRWWGQSLPSISYSMITAIVFIGAYFLSYKKHQNNNFSSIPLKKWILLIILCYVVVNFFAVSSSLHLKAMIDFFKMFIILALAYKVIDSEKKLEYAILVYLAGCAYIGYEAYSVGRNSFGRVEGIGTLETPEANGTAAILVPALPFLIYYFWYKNYKVKRYWLFSEHLL